MPKKITMPPVERLKVKTKPVYQANVETRRCACQKHVQRTGSSYPFCANCGHERKYHSQNAGRCLMGLYQRTSLLGGAYDPTDDNFGLGRRRDNIYYEENPPDELEIESEIL